MFEVNNLTAIAKSTTPNTFLMIFMPFLPINFSIFTEVLSTMYKKIVLIIMAITIFMVENSALNESNVVKLPGPANKGNASGNTEAVLAFVSSSLYREMPKIISNAKKNKIKEPATAKELTSMPIRLKILVPKNRKATMIKHATIDAFSE